MSDYPQCDPTRHGNMGVMHCPHGCVTECAKERAKPVPPDSSFLWDEDATDAEVIAGYQDLINTGMAWRLEGHVGRTAMALIEQGKCMLGEQGHHDFYGNYVPSRHEVKAGTKGSPEYCQAREED